MIQRPQALKAIATAIDENPVCALLGPSQCGKTTPAKGQGLSGTQSVEEEHTET